VARSRSAPTLFDHTPAHRIQVSTDTQNHAEQRALEKAGCQREGIIHGAIRRGGRWHDQILYSLLRPGSNAPR
jgi:RimJ/RimL family protein N-acetyltransferase